MLYHVEFCKCCDRFEVIDWLNDRSIARLIDEFLRKAVEEDRTYWPWPLQNQIIRCLVGMYGATQHSHFFFKCHFTCCRPVGAATRKGHPQQLGLFGLRFAKPLRLIAQSWYNFIRKVYHLTHQVQLIVSTLRFETLCQPVYLQESVNSMFRKLAAVSRETKNDRNQANWSF